MISKEQVDIEMQARLDSPGFILDVNGNEYKIGIHGLVFRLTYDDSWNKSSWSKTDFMKELRSQSKQYLREMEAVT